MILLDWNFEKIATYDAWCLIRDEADRVTAESREKVRMGMVSPSALVGVVYAHPCCQRTWYTGLAIDPLARQRRKSQVRMWDRALTQVRYLAGTKRGRRFRTFKEAMRMIERRYPSTSQLAGFREAAAIAWNKVAGTNVPAAPTFDLVGIEQREIA